MTVGETLLLSLQSLSRAKQCPCGIASDLAGTILILAYCHFPDNLPDALDLSCIQATTAHRRRCLLLIATSPVAR
jgi:hypothetical protein